MSTLLGNISFRDQLAIARHEVTAAWIVCCDMLDRPESVTEDHFERLTLAMRRLQALEAT